jgi:nitrogen regulatory protein P-II 1
MKKIDAIIRDERLPMVLAILREKGYPGITVSQVKGHGRQKGAKQVYREVEYVVEFVPKTRIELVVDDEHVEPLMDAISDHARTGAVGDGKIWVTPIESLMRVRTGEKGAAAV